jgi:hypothetical protein
MIFGTIWKARDTELDPTPAATLAFATDAGAALAVE